MKKGDKKGDKRKQKGDDTGHNDTQEGTQEGRQKETEGRQDGRNDQLYQRRPKTVYKVSHRDELSNCQRLKPFQLAAINSDLLGCTWLNSLQGQNRQFKRKQNICKSTEYA